MQLCLRLWFSWNNSSHSYKREKSQLKLSSPFKLCWLWIGTSKSNSLFQLERLLGRRQSDYMGCVHRFFGYFLWFLKLKQIDPSVEVSLCRSLTIMNRGVRHELVSWVTRLYIAVVAIEIVDMNFQSVLKIDNVNKISRSSR